MAVTVTRSGSLKEETYPEGMDTRVENGHLLVLGQDKSLRTYHVAVFAPNMWVKATATAE